MGFTHVSLSSKAMPMVKVVPRGFTGNLHSIISTSKIHSPDGTTYTVYTVVNTDLEGGFLNCLYVIFPRQWQ